MIHAELMQKVLQLARLGHGKVLPNPMVGCLIYKNKEIVGKGWHKKYGDDHAEIEAINDCKKKFGEKKALNLIKGSTFIVNLEPCSIEQNTPPCCQTLIDLKIKKVICGTKDPNPKINGNGIKRLRSAGIEVEIDCLKDECQNLNKVFFTNQLLNRPFITLKFAQSLDQKIGKRQTRQTISNDLSRADVQRIRAEHQSILIGSKTLIADNPKLTIRNKKVSNKMQPIKIVLGNISIDIEKKNIFKNYSKIIFGSSKKINIPKKYLINNVENIILNKKEFLGLLMQELMQRDIKSVLVEGGSKILSSFIKGNYFDELIVYTAPKLIGSSGIEALDKKANKSLNRLEVNSIENFDDDIKVKYVNN
tara:strand:+ start:2541 stop:3629 length:1089 start_codon:yes stop_codon:yes gene_type:complete